MFIIIIIIIIIITITIIIIIIIIIMIMIIIIIIIIILLWSCFGDFFSFFKTISSWPYSRKYKYISADTVSLLH